MTRYRLSIGVACSYSSTPGNLRLLNSIVCIALGRSVEFRVLKLREKLLEHENYEHEQSTRSLADKTDTRLSSRSPI